MSDTPRNPSTAMDPEEAEQILISFLYHSKKLKPTPSNPPSPVKPRKEDSVEFELEFEKMMKK